jgi:DNA-directed RNA polymerase subunit RPC12/RpoP
MAMTKMKCPKCGKRVFDISCLPKDQIYVELKCPNCHRVVSVPCTKESTMNAS